MGKVISISTKLLIYNILQTLRYGPGGNPTGLISACQLLCPSGLQHYAEHFGFMRVVAHPMRLAISISSLPYQRVTPCLFERSQRGGRGFEPHAVHHSLSHPPISLRELDIRYPGELAARMTQLQHFDHATIRAGRYI